MGKLLKSKSTKKMTVTDVEVSMALSLTAEAERISYEGAVIPRFNSERVCIAGALCGGLSMDNDAQISERSRYWDLVHRIPAGLTEYTPTQLLRLLERKKLLP